MKLLVVGTGAREHALVHRLRRDVGVTTVIAAPGNPGIARLVRSVPVDVTDPEAIFALAEAERVDLTVVGPEAPLAAGVADRFQAGGRLLLGPTRAAAALETSKAFAKAFMARHGVPTARFLDCDAVEEALAAVARGELGWPLVVKADGLAAGKGVVIAQDRGEAEAAVRAAMLDKRFGAAGARVVFEECLVGREASFFVLADGTRFVTLDSAEDHKRIFDGDRGPNTGGMGAYSPSPLLTPAVRAQVVETIVRPVIDGMRAEGHPFRGFLYVGLMLTEDGPKVIEFNVRLGDPEAQVVLPRIETSLWPLLRDAAAGSLDGGLEAVALGSAPHVGVVLAASGYPDAVRSGDAISGIDAAEAAGAVVFHAGTAMKDGRLVTSGGRVLTVVASGADFQSAIDAAYAAARHISFEGMQLRHDIGARALGASSRGASRRATSTEPRR